MAGIHQTRRDDGLVKRKSCALVVAVVAQTGGAVRWTADGEVWSLELAPRCFCSIYGRHSNARLAALVSVGTLRQ